MSQVITKRFASFAQAFLKGRDTGGTADAGRTAAAGEHVQLAPARPSRGRTAAKAREAHREPVRLLVQRQRHSRALLDSEPRPARISTPPCLSPLAPFRNDIHVLSGLDNSAATVPGPGNGHHKSISGVDELHAVYRPRRGRTVHRPGDRREDRQRVALPLAPDRRLAGVLRREHPAQHELGRLQSPAAAARCCRTSSSIACSARAKKAG